MSSSCRCTFFFYSIIFIKLFFDCTDKLLWWCCDFADAIQWTSFKYTRTYCKDWVTSMRNTSTCDDGRKFVPLFCMQLACTTTEALTMGNALAKWFDVKLIISTWSNGGRSTWSWELKICNWQHSTKLVQAPCQADASNREQCFDIAKLPINMHSWRLQWSKPARVIGLPLTLLPFNFT